MGHSLFSKYRRGQVSRFYDVRRRKRNGMRAFTAISEISRSPGLGSQSLHGSQDGGGEGDAE